MTVDAQVESKMHAQCPSCMASLIIPENEAADQARCPVCRHVFDVPYPMAEVAIGVEPAAAAIIVY